MTDRTGDFGAIHAPVLHRIRNLWHDLEPIVADTGYDEETNPTELRIVLSDGIGAATGARFDIQWSLTGNYSFHYIDTEDVNWRFDRHPNMHSPEKHFHPPPDAATADAEPSCIQVEAASLVTRAVYTLWRLAYDNDDVSLLNTVMNPP